MWKLFLILCCIEIYTFVNIKLENPLSQIPLPVNLIGCDRAFQYDLALKSLAGAVGTKYRDKVAVFASVDCDDKETINVVKKWERSDKLRVIYVESFQMHDRRQPGRLDERVARHWLSSNNRLFSTGWYDNVIYLESDHIVAPDFFEAAEALIAYADKHFGTQLFMLNMGHHGDYPNSNDNELSIYPLQNIGVIYRRHGWEKFITTGVEKFCRIYGDWDHNMHNLLAKGDIPGYDSKSLGYDVPRVKHTKTCYTSRRHFSHDCGGDPDKLHQQEYDDFVNKKTKNNLKKTLVFTGKVSKKHYGGPGTPADKEIREMCLESIKTNMEHFYFYSTLQ